MKLTVKKRKKKHGEIPLKRPDFQSTIMKDIFKRLNNKTELAMEDGLKVDFICHFTNSHAHKRETVDQMNLCLVTSKS